MQIRRNYSIWAMVGVSSARGLPGEYVRKLLRLNTTDRLRLSLEQMSSLSFPRALYCSNPSLEFAQRYIQQRRQKQVT